MFTTHFGLFWIFLLCCCNKSEAKLFFKNRINVALAGTAVTHHLVVTVPANSTEGNIKCYHNSRQVWEHVLNHKASPTPRHISLSANITMHNSSCSGEYYFKYLNEKRYWVVLVQDVGYLPDTENFFIPLLVVIIVLLLLCVTGSVYIFRLYKNYSPSEVDEDKGKAKKRKKNTVATEEGGTSDSVYTVLEPRTVSIYDVLDVDEARRRANTESQTTQKKEESSPVAEGIFECVYENL